MKKLMCLALSLAMSISLFAGCGGDNSASTAPESSDAGTEESAPANDDAEDGGADATAEAQAAAGAAGQWKVGYNYYTGGSYALIALKNSSYQVVSAFGGEPLEIDDEMSVEKIIQDVENMIASGCDGLLIWLPAETLYPTVGEICKNAGVPFVLNDKVPEDPDIIAELKANPYCVGAIGPANAVYGENIANYALAQGYTTCIISSGEVGDPTDTPRLEAFRAVFEAGGGAILEEIHGTNTEAQAYIENALIVNPNPDFIYGTGSDFGNAACDALLGKGFDTVVLSSGLDNTSLERLADPDNPMAMVNGDYWICGMFAAIILQNHLDGTPLLDANGDAVWYTDVMPFEVPAEQYDLYQRFFLDEYPYSADEILQFSGANNAEFNYDAFMELVNSYSLEERLTTRYNEGKITKEEMEAAGISVQ